MYENQNILLTTFQQEKREKKIRVISEFDTMMKEPDAMVTAVEDLLMKKYNIHSRSTLWLWRKQLAKELVPEDSEDVKS